MKKILYPVLLVLLLACVVGLLINFLPKQAPQHVTMTPPAPSDPYGYDIPVQPESPWPTFRRDRRNTGASPLPAEYQGDRPWRFQTGKGIFSTPVIDADGLIYFGSADHYFYALNPDGSLNWKYETGEIIDFGRCADARRHYLHLGRWPHVPLPDRRDAGVGAAGLGVRGRAAPGGEL